MVYGCVWRTRHDVVLHKFNIAPQSTLVLRRHLGIVARVYPYPGYCAIVLQKSQKFRARVWGSYRTYRSSGYGYGSVIELTEAPGSGMNFIQNLQKFRIRV